MWWCQLDCAVCNTVWLQFLFLGNCLYMIALNLYIKSKSCAQNLHSLIFEFFSKQKLHFQK